MGFIGSYVWQLRQVWGTKRLLIPGACALVVNEDGALLLGLRTDTHDWCHFGGTGEPGQDAETTMVRELEEEAGIVPTVYRPFAMTSRLDNNLNIYPNGDELHHWSLCYLVTGWRGEIGQGDDEHSALQFFQPHALPEPLSKDTANLLRLLQSFRDTGAFQVR